MAIGDNVSIGKGCGIAVQGRLSIGDRTYLNPRSRINAMVDVRVGKDCAIAWDVDILDTDFHTVVVDGVERPSSAPIIIEDRVRIGVGAKILKGAHIRSDSIVAAGAIVNKEFLPNSLIGGVPAKIIRQVDGWQP